MTEKKHKWMDGDGAMTQTNVQFYLRKTDSLGEGIQKSFYLHRQRHRPVQASLSPAMTNSIVAQQGIHKTDMQRDGNDTL